jgi:hypothetical protein
MEGWVLLKWILFYKQPNRELAFKVSREFQWILQEWSPSARH